MSVSPETSEIIDETQNEQRRRSTTVIMTMNVTTVPPAAEDGLRRNGSVRRRLSKQNATIEEPISLLSISDDASQSPETTVPCIEEHPEEGKDDSEDQPTQSINDGMKLRPPGLLAQKKMWSTSKSLSRESNGTEYSDRSGVDLRTFVERTLHKSEEDRKQLLEFEEVLKQMVLDETVQSKKFELPSSYHRMLLHRCAAWFGLDHNVTNKQTDIVVNKSDKTKIPEESFSEYIRHDNYCDDRFKRQNTGGSRKELHHMESFGEQTSQYGSQASLNHDLLMMRRAQSFDVAQVSGPIQQHSPQHTRGFPIRQHSLNCQPQVVGSPVPSGHHGHQWAPQRSFDCSNNSYLCTSKHPMMRKAESFGGMANGISQQCYEPMVCQTPPNVIHHLHHHSHHVPQPPPPASSYTGYQMFDEVPMGSPNYAPVQDSGMCSPGGTYYEYIPQQYARPIRYLSHDYQPRRPQSTSYMYGPPQYVPYQSPMVHPEVEVIVDPVQSQPFPPIGQFVMPTPEQQQGYSSSHQAETANSFIKASIDGGYGSMNQETDSSGNAEKVEDVSSQ